MNAQSIRSRSNYPELIWGCVLNGLAYLARPSYDSDTDSNWNDAAADFLQKERFSVSEWASEPFALRYLGVLMRLHTLIALQKNVFPVQYH